MKKTSTLGAAVRMSAGFLGIPVPSLVAHPAYFEPLDLTSVGAIPLTLDKLKLPHLSVLGIDLRRPLSLDFLYKDGGHPVITVAEFRFANRPTEIWWRNAHARRSLAVVFADPEQLAEPETAWEGAQRLVESGALVGVVPLAIFGFPNGVGTRPPTPHAGGGA